MAIHKSADGPGGMEWNAGSCGLLTGYAGYGFKIRSGGCQLKSLVVAVCSSRFHYCTMPLTYT
jgi:hypothetical protein